MPKVRTPKAPPAMQAAPEPKPAGKRTVTTVEELPIQEVEAAPPIVEDPEIEQADPSDVQVMELLEELHGDASARLRIYRQGASYTDLTLLGECSIEEFDPMMLAHPPYNGGQFRIHARSASGIKLNRLLKVAAHPSVQMGASAHGGTGLDIAMLIKDGFAQIAEKFSRPPENPLNTLQGIKQIAEIIRPPESPKNSTAKELMEHLQLMEALRSFAGNGERGPFNEDGEIKAGPLLNKAADFFLAAMGKAQEAQATPAGALPNPAATAPASTATAPNPSPAKSTPSDQEKALMFFKLQLWSANKSAEAGDDPEEFADQIFSMISDDMLKLIQTDPEWFKKLCEVEPECAKHEEWYKRVRQSLIEAGIEEGVLTAAQKPASVPEPGNKSGPSTGETTGA
jgi:hypothetical protein